jgi:hypothetical protein
MVFCGFSLGCWAGAVAALMSVKATMARMSVFMVVVKRRESGIYPAFVSATPCLKP